MQRLNWIGVIALCVVSVVHAVWYGGKTFWSEVPESPIWYVFLCIVIGLGAFFNVDDEKKYKACVARLLWTACWCAVAYKLVQLIFELSVTAFSRGQWNPVLFLICSTAILISWSLAIINFFSIPFKLLENSQHPES